MPPKKKSSSSSSSSSSHSRSIINIDPSQVYFTHARIRPVFTGCNKRIEETLQEIIDGRTNIKDIPKITVLNNNGHLFSLNNRRLYLIKQLYSMNLLTTVEVQLKEATDKEKARYTPSRCVLNARLMKEFPKDSSANEGEEELAEEDVDGKASEEER
jgi:hypothetical protein